MPIHPNPKCEADAASCLRYRLPRHQRMPVHVCNIGDQTSVRASATPGPHDARFFGAVAREDYKAEVDLFPLQVGVKVIGVLHT
jgi:hypothetical protein